MPAWLKAIAGLVRQRPAAVVALEDLIEDPSGAEIAAKRATVAEAWRSDDWNLHRQLAQVLTHHQRADLSAVPLAALASACLSDYRAQRPDRRPSHAYFDLEKSVRSALVQQPISLREAAKPAWCARLQLVQALRLGPWTSSLPSFLDGEAAQARAGWVHLFLEALRFWSGEAPAKNVKPRRLEAFRKHASQSIAAIGMEHFCGTLRGWLPKVDVAEEAGLYRGEDFLCGAMIAASTLKDGSVAAAIAGLLERSYRSFGYDGFGTAAIVALSRMPEGSGMASLLNARIGRRAGQLRREKLLARLAEQQNTTVEALADVGSPDLGLDDDCQLVRDIGDYRAVVRPEGSRRGVVAWYAMGGKPLRATPAAVKQSHAADVRQLAIAAKELGTALLGRIEALERSYLSPRPLPSDSFLARLRQQPIERHLATRLIWRIEAGGSVQTVLWREHGPEDSAGRPATIPQDAAVSLWHPLHGTLAEAAAWRSRIMDLGLVQPFKQAHRETYVVTDAERATETYSNRFAAHILRQRQFAQIMSQRGWRYGLQGDYDSHNEAELRLPGGLTAFFSVDRPNFEQERYGIFQYIATDRVHFLRAERWLPLLEVPPVVFSECMRHVDLAVAVSSIGNDPQWQDGGPDAFGLPYWQDYGTGPLESIGDARRDLLLAIVPRLAIADRLSVDDRWLNVRGVRGAYRIHIRSLQVEMRPSGRHLCIVDKGKAVKVALPFEGDDSLSLLLSKAHLLVQDDRIADPGIKAQIDSALRG